MDKEGIQGLPRKDIMPLAVHAQQFVVGALHFLCYTTLTLVIPPVVRHT